MPLKIISVTPLITLSVGNLFSIPPLRREYNDGWRSWRRSVRYNANRVNIATTIIPPTPYHWFVRVVSTLITFASSLQYLSPHRRLRTRHGFPLPTDNNNNNTNNADDDNIRYCDRSVCVCVCFVILYDDWTPWANRRTPMENRTRCPSRSPNNICRRPRSACSRPARSWPDGREPIPRECCPTIGHRVTRRDLCRDARRAQSGHVPVNLCQWISNVNVAGQRIALILPDVTVVVSVHWVDTRTAYGRLPTH